MSRAVCLILLAISCAHGSIGPTHATSRPYEHDLVALISAVLAHDETDPQSPARRVIGAGPLLLQAEIGGGPLRIPPEAVSDRGGWKLETVAALQSRADAKGDAVYHAAIFDLQIAGDVASVVFGSDIEVPRREKDVVIMCCEEATDEYRRNDDGWTFVRRVELIAH